MGRRPRGEARREARTERRPGGEARTGKRPGGEEARTGRLGGQSSPRQPRSLRTGTGWLRRPQGCRRGPISQPGGPACPPESLRSLCPPTLGSGALSYSPDALTLVPRTAGPLGGNVCLRPHILSPATTVLPCPAPPLPRPCRARACRSTGLRVPAGPAPISNPRSGRCSSPTAATGPGPGQRAGGTGPLPPAPPAHTHTHAHRLINSPSNSHTRLHTHTHSHDP